jgi:hypothetical protein
MTVTPFVNSFFRSAHKCTVFFLGLLRLRCADLDPVTRWVIHTHLVLSSDTSSLSYRARREVLAQIAPRYQEATGAQKTLLLDRVVEITGYERKYAITLLNHVSEIPAHILRPRQPVYGTAVQEALFLAWRAIHYPCAQRLVPFLPSLLSFLERDGHLRLSEEHFVVLIFLCPSALLGNKT